MKVKNRTFIQMLAFITVSIFMIVYFSIVAYADTFNLDFVKYDIGDITFNDTDDEIPIFLNRSNTSFNYIWETYGPNFNFVANVSGVVDTSLAENYIMVGSGDSVIGYYMPKDTFLIYDEYGYLRIVAKKSDYDILMSNDNQLLQGIFYAEYSTYGYMSLPISLTVDGDNYVSTSHLNNFKVLSSNCAIYRVPDVDLFTSMNDIIGDNVNPNYNNSDTELSEDLAFNPNDLYTYFSDNWSGKVVTSVGVSKEQLKLDNDSSGINFNYTFNIKFKGFAFDIANNIGQININNLMYDYTYDGSFKYIVPLSSMNDGYYELDNSIVLNGIRGTLIQTNKFTGEVISYPNYTFMQCVPLVDLDSMTFVSKDSARLGLSVGSLSLSLPFDDSGRFDYFDLNYSCYPTCDDKRGGQMVFNYSAKSGQANYSTTMPDSSDVQKDISNYNNQNNLSYGDEGYKNPSDYYPTNVGSNGVVNGQNTANGGSASANGGVAYGSNVNNSVIVNTEQDPKAVVDYVKNELVPTGDSLGFVDKLEQVVEKNDFLVLMENTFSFVPQTVWSDLSVFVSIILGVLVAGFVLRIILDLL